MSEKVLVYGVAVAGMATLKALLARGYEVIVVDDSVNPQKAAAVSNLGCDLIERPGARELGLLISSCDFVAPAPGIPEAHPLISESCARGVPLRSELDLAYEWESKRVGGPRPIVAVTGTDGKTTTVLMTESILAAAGRRPVACGNTEVPFVEALDMDVDSFVVEATSFRLAFVDSFRCRASAWLNLAPDHLDWHSSMSTYEAAKARIWKNVRPTDSAIGFEEDPIVMKHLRGLECRKLTVGSNAADYRIESGRLIAPRGPIIDVSDLSRSLPHDRINALTATALALEAGLADIDSAAQALSEFRGPKHRIEFVMEGEGVRYFDDSKATTPHAALTAMRGFDSIVLIAGGRNKDLDLSAMADEIGRLRGVVLIGEAREELARVFHGRCAISMADSMNEAVERASEVAEPGDVVLLSPGCTSLDQYGGYAERGDDFARCVREIVRRSKIEEETLSP
jgi:UDP-N-acetylmuramoylalanine--D-glutamate ligase